VEDVFSCDITNILAKMEDFLKHEKTFTIPRYISESQDHTMGKKSCKTCKCYTFHYSILTSGIHKLLFVEKMTFTGKNNTTIQ